MIDTTEAVRLAAEAIHRTRCCDNPLGHAWGFYEDHAAAAVAAALPALAEQFAALIEEKGAAARLMFVNPDMEMAAQATFSVAARLVREAAEVTG